ncbi:MAG: hypothetical protein B6I19_05215 [Bacteroidetes bacterium 4572_114]|nr:MAG: hypothetical protein B6I19_05215 [Bacteroidetes bacterium 4572_114]
MLKCINENITFNLIPIAIGTASLMSFIIKNIIVIEYLSIYSLSHLSIITKPVLILKNTYFPVK